MAASDMAAQDMATPHWPTWQLHYQPSEQLVSQQTQSGQTSQQSRGKGVSRKGVPASFKMIS